MVQFVFFGRSNWAWPPKFQSVHPEVDICVKFKDISSRRSIDTGKSMRLDGHSEKPKHNELDYKCETQREAHLEKVLCRKQFVQKLQSLIGILGRSSITAEQKFFTTAENRGLWVKRTSGEQHENSTRFQIWPPLPSLFLTPLWKKLFDIPPQ